MMKMAVARRKQDSDGLMDDLLAEEELGEGVFDDEGCELRA